NTDQPGGQLMGTTEVENYPGFVDGIMGPDLMANMRAQAERFGAKFLTRRVQSVDLSVSPKRIVVDDGELFARSVIVATGANALMLGLPNERRLVGYGVSTCATCDGFFFRGRDIVVVGGGDSALEEAIFLTKFGDSVTVVHRRKELRASKIMQDRAFANPKIRFVWNALVNDILGDTKVEGVVLQDTVTGGLSTVPAAAVFVAIGHAPTTELFTGQLDLDANGYIVTHDGTATNIDGVFACGDVVDHVYRQAVTAAGMGCMAAIDTERWLEAHSRA
ncbi:MAG TPA: FAD-dependent oxidoreductase, partial [Acidimicrobiales bacterium]|nr:FAD-dependent oxidoreductase [Acidimicrobiales bacterium]